MARRITDVESTNRRNAGLLGQARDSAHELQELAGELGGALGRFHIERAPPKTAS